jgi:hypothetical protein
MNEERKGNRPSCGYKVTTKDEKGVERYQRCGSEDGLLEIRGKGKYAGTPRTTPVCREHIERALKEWTWDEAVPCTPQRR